MYTDYGDDESQLYVYPSENDFFCLQEGKYYTFEINDSYGNLKEDDKGRCNLQDDAIITAATATTATATVAHLLLSMSVLVLPRRTMVLVPSQLLEVTLLPLLVSLPWLPLLPPCSLGLSDGMR